MKANNTASIHDKNHQGSEMPKLQNFPDAIITLQTPSSAYHDTISALRFLQSYNVDEKSLGHQNYQKINQLIMENILKIITKEDSSLDPRKHRVVRTECFLILSSLLGSNINFEAGKMPIISLKNSYSSFPSKQVLKITDDNFAVSDTETIKRYPSGLETNPNRDQNDTFSACGISDSNRNNEHSQKIRLPAIMKKKKQKKTPFYEHIVKIDGTIERPRTPITEKKNEYPVGIDDKNREEQVESSSFSLSFYFSFSLSLSLPLSQSLSLSFSLSL